MTTSDPSGDGLTAVLKTIDDRLAGISRRMDRKFARNLTVMVLLVIAVGVALGVAFTARQDLASSNSNTADARIASCEQFNLQQDHDISGADQGAVILANHLAPLPRSEAIQRQVDDFLADMHAAAIKRDTVNSDATTDVGKTHRICTPEGIAVYLRRR